MRTVTLSASGIESTANQTYVQEPLFTSEHDYYHQRPQKLSVVPKPYREPKRPNAEKWLQLAFSEEPDKKAYFFRRIYGYNKIWSFATDGFRIHRTKEKVKRSRGKAPNVVQVFDTKFLTTFVVSRSEMLRAIACCMPFVKWFQNSIQLVVTDHLEVTTHSAEFGDVSVKLYTSVEGAPQSISINHEYLYQAVLGMPDTFKIGIIDPKAPIMFYSFDGKYDAIVMPIYRDA